MSSKLTKNQVLGISLLLIAQAIFAVNFSVIKYLTQFYTVLQLMLFRFFLGTLILAPIVLKRPVFKKEFNHFMLIRALFGFCAMVCVFLGYKYGDAGQVTLIFYCSVIWASIIARYVYHERPHIISVSALFFAFAGLFLILRPDLAPLTKGAWFGVAGSVFNIGVILSLKKCRQYFSSTTIVFVFCFLGCVFALPFAQIHLLSFSSLKWIGLVGLLSTSAQYLFTKGYKYCYASVSSSMGIITIALMYISGFLFFGESITFSALMGVLTVVGSIGLIARFQ
jgi:drug/metabolite transporter (DMT)-like permease